MTLWLVAALVAQLQIPAPVGRVNDFADAIDPATEQQMLAVIEEVHAKSRGEIVVVTLRDLGGRASIDLARDIGREWLVGARGGPGDPARNTGVIILLKPGERPGDGRAELAIATGTGAEGFVTDALSGRIRDAIGEASVRTGSYGQGLAVGVSLLAEAYAREFGFELTGARPAARTTPRGDPTPPWAKGFRVLITLAVIIGFIALSAGARYGRRGYYRRGSSGLGWFLLGTLLSGGRRGGGWRGGGFGGGGGWSGGGFGGFGGGGGFSGGGASGRF